MAMRQEFRQRIRQGYQSEELPSAEYVFAIGMIGGIGLSTLWIHQRHLFARSESLPTTLVGAVLPMCLSVVLLGLSMWLHWQDFDGEIARIGGWCLAGAVVLVGVSIASITYQYSRGVLIADPLFVMTDHVTVGAILGSLIGIYDVQRHRRGRDLHTERERARQLSSRVTVLNRLLRHDIRTAVNVIQGNTMLLQKDRQDRDAVIRNIVEKTNELEAVSERARQLEQLLDRDVGERTKIDLGVVLQMKALKYKDEHPEIELVTEIPTSVEVYAVSLIEDAIEELLENAIEHNDASTPRIVVTATPVSAHSRRNDERSETVTIRICDNGPGIPENANEVLERGHETDLKHLNGLGLWLAYWAVERSGGGITFKENDPRGSIVEIRLQSVESKP